MKKAIVIGIALLGVAGIALFVKRSNKQTSHRVCKAFAADPGMTWEEAEEQVFLGICDGVSWMPEKWARMEAAKIIKRSKELWEKEYAAKAQPETAENPWETTEEIEEEFKARMRAEAAAGDSFNPDTEEVPA